MALLTDKKKKIIFSKGTYDVKTGTYTDSSGNSQSMALSNVPKGTTILIGGSGGGSSSHTQTHNTASTPPANLPQSTLQTPTQPATPPKKIIETTQSNLQNPTISANQTTGAIISSFEQSQAEKYQEKIRQEMIRKERTGAFGGNSHLAEQYYKEIYAKYNQEYQNKVNDFFHRAVEQEQISEQNQYNSQQQTAPRYESSNPTLDRILQNPNVNKVIDVVVKGAEINKKGAEFVGVGVPFTPFFMSVKEIKEKKYIPKGFSFFSKVAYSPLQTLVPQESRAKVENFGGKIGYFGGEVTEILLPETPVGVATLGLGYGTYAKSPKLVKRGVDILMTGGGGLTMLNSKLTPQERVAGGLIFLGGGTNIVRSTRLWLNKEITLRITPKVQDSGSTANQNAIRGGEKMFNVAQFDLLGVNQPRYKFVVQRKQLLPYNLFNIKGKGSFSYKKWSFQELETFFPKGQYKLYSSPSTTYSFTESFYVNKEGIITAPVRRGSPQFVGMMTIKTTPSRTTLYLSKLEGINLPAEKMGKKLTPLQREQLSVIETLFKGNKEFVVKKNYPFGKEFFSGEIKTTDLFRVSSKGKLVPIPYGKRIMRGNLLAEREQLSKMEFERGFLREESVYNERLGYVETTFPKYRRFSKTYSLEGSPKVRNRLDLIFQGSLGRYTPSRNKIEIQMFQKDRFGVFLHEYGHFTSGGIKGNKGNLYWKDMKLPKEIKAELSKAGFFKAYKERGYRRSEVGEEVFAEYFRLREQGQLNPIEKSTIPKTRNFFEGILESKQNTFTKGKIDDMLLKTKGQKTIVDLYGAILKGKKNVKAIGTTELIGKGKLIRGKAYERYWEIPSNALSDSESSGGRNFFVGRGRQVSKTKFKFNPKVRETIQQQIIAEVPKQEKILKVYPIRTTKTITKGFTLGILSSVSASTQIEGQGQETKTTQPQSTPTLFREDLRMESLESTRQVHRNATREITKEISREILREENKTIQREETKLTQKNLLRLQFKPIQRTGLITILSPPTTTKTTTPKFILPFIPIESKKGGSFGFFSVQVRRFGKFRTIGKGLSLSQAFNLGRKKTSTTLGATFKIVGLGKKNVGTPFGYYQKGEMFIEKPKYRLSTPTEISEIQMFKGMKGGIRI